MIFRLNMDILFFFWFIDGVVSHIVWRQTTCPIHIYKPKHNLIFANGNRNNFKRIKHKFTCENLFEFTTSPLRARATHSQNNRRTADTISNCIYQLKILTISHVATNIYTTRDSIGTRASLWYSIYIAFRNGRNVQKLWFTGASI